MTEIKTQTGHTFAYADQADQAQTFIGAGLIAEKGIASDCDQGRPAQTDGPKF